MFDRRWLLAPGLALAGILFAVLPAMAGVLDASWTAPTTNTDGSALTDLASYRVYFGTTNSPCPSGTFVTVPSPSSTPPAGQTVSTRLTGLANNTTYFVAVVAVDAGGNPSACTGAVSALANPEISVAPTMTVPFGDVNIGSFAEQTFQVTANRNGVSGTASVAAPFTIQSGSPFSLNSGGVANVVVRFTPTNTTPQNVNVNFTADGDSMSRLVTGTGLPIGPTLTVTKSGAGTGTVSSTPAGINCGSACSAAYATGTPVTLTATPAAGSTFNGWSGGGASCGSTNPCVVTLTANTTVTAAFITQSFALTVNKTGNGTGTVTSAPTGINCGATCSFTYSFNTQVTLTQTAATGSTFTGWSGACTGTGSCVVTMNAAKTVTANFTVPTFVLTVNKAGAGTGTVTSTPAGVNCGATCSFAYNINTLVTLTAAPAPGSSFTSWSGACAGSGGCTVTMSAARTVTATFGVSTVTFTDNPVVAGTTMIKVVHVAELRTAVAMARARNGLGAFTWGDTLTANTTAVKAAHITELRTAINQIYTALQRTVPAYTDSTLVPGKTTPKAAHVQELRNAVTALP